MTRPAMRRPGLPPARRAGSVAVDWTRCFDYQRLVDEELEVYSTIEVTEELKEGGIAANPAWEGWYRFLAARWGTDFGSEIVAAASRFESPRLLSLGCGHGGFELGVARKLPGCRLLALDLNEGVFAAARAEVAREGLDVTFQAIDLNFVELEPRSFDVVFAHAALHHVLNFEHLLEQVYEALVDDGRLVVLDVIGKTQAIFWPENVRFATELVAGMPERYRAGVQLDARALFPGYLDGADQSGMEGIRQEELEEQLARWFRPRQSFKYNAFVRLICTQPELVPRFERESAEDLAYLEGLYRLDLERIASGALRPTEMFAVYEKRPRAEVPAPLPREAGAAGAPSVSVLVTCDGTPEELRTCLASLDVQTHGPAEIVLLQTCDGEGLAGAARELAAARPRARFVGRAEAIDPRGLVDWPRVVAGTGGQLLAHASGRDAWYPIKLAEQVALLERSPGAGMVYCQSLVVDGRGRRTARPFGRDVVGEPPSGEVPAARSPTEVPRSTALVRRDALLEVLAAEGAAGDPWRAGHPACPAVFDPRPMAMLRAPATLDRPAAGSAPAGSAPAESAPAAAAAARAAGAGELPEAEVGQREMRRASRGLLARLVQRLRRVRG